MSTHPLSLVFQLARIKQCLHCTEPRLLEEVIGARERVFGALYEADLTDASLSK